MSNSPLLQFDRVDSVITPTTIDVTSEILSPHATLDVNVVTIASTGLKADFEVTVIMRYGATSITPPGDVYVDQYGDIYYGGGGAVSDTYVDLYGDDYGIADPGSGSGNYEGSYAASY